MSELIANYGLFLAKTVTLVIAVLVILSALAGLAVRQRRGEGGGRIELTHLNDRRDAMRTAVQQAVLDKRAHKRERKASKQVRKQRKSSAGRRVYYLHFDGDLRASAAESLRHEVSAILTTASDGDEVVLALESQGGLVHAYGLAASQLQRIRAQGLTLTIAIDRVAASGGYLMACIGERILCAPFAVVGSIGVMAQVPNVHRLLKNHDIDVELLTAGEFKRTLTVLGENTETGRAKFLEELEEVHGLFKTFVREHRASLDVERVATGEAWHGSRALELGLVDEIATSDEYLMRACDDADVYKVQWVEHRSPLERIMHRAGASAGRQVGRTLERWLEPRRWTA